MIELILKTIQIIFLKKCTILRIINYYLNPKASRYSVQNTREMALSYFIAGENKECDEDQGFALSKWSKITFENSQITINGDLGFAMGNYYFENESEKVKVEFSFGYREINDSIKIFLHHSSIPYKL